jgi:hypothetical protein
LNPNHDEPHSNFDCNFNLRRYNEAERDGEDEAAAEVLDELEREVGIMAGGFLK